MSNEYYNPEIVTITINGEVIKGFSMDHDIIANGDPTDQVTFGELEDSTEDTDNES